MGDSTWGPSSLFSESQKIALVAVPLVAAWVSTLSSGAILYTLFFDTVERKNSPFRRLFLGSTVMDLLFSGTAALMSGWGVPRDPWTTQRWASGNVQTCNLMGFLLILGGCGQLLYSAALAIYHLSVVRFKLTNKTIARCLEPVMHSVTIALALSASSVALRANYINVSHVDPGICGPATHPPNCLHYDDIPCQRGHLWVNAYHAYSTTYATLVIITWVVMIVCYILLWWTVRETERRMRRYGAGRQLRWTGRVGRQGMMFVGCFSAAQIMGMLRRNALYPFFETSLSYRSLYFGVQLVSLPLIQLQGFFHAAVFFWSRWEFLVQPGRSWTRFSRGRNLQAAAVQESEAPQSFSAEESGKFEEADDTSVVAELQME